MADPEHLAKLKEGVKAWNKWRKDNSGIIPNLERADLGAANLERADLRHTAVVPKNWTM